MRWMTKILGNTKHNVLGINERNIQWIYPNNQRKHYELADDKVLTKDILEKHNIPTAKKIQVIESVGEIEAKLKELNFPACAIKPAKGRGGGGILILDHGTDSWMKSGKPYSIEKIHRHVANIVFGVFSFGAEDKVLIEEKIVPHQAFLDIYPEGVADLRLIYENGRLVMAMMRVPTEKSDGRANLHQGAVGIGVDLETGYLTTGYDGKNVISKHPDSGLPFADIKIPFWEETLAIGKATFDAYPLNFLGVDVAFDQEKGPMILEVNVRPGLQIQNANQKGMKA